MTEATILPTLTASSHSILSYYVQEDVWPPQPADGKGAALSSAHPKVQALAAAKHSGLGFPTPQSPHWAGAQITTKGKYRQRWKGTAGACLDWQGKAPWRRQH